MRKGVIRAGLETLYFSGMHRVARQFLAGSGTILTFHRVRPQPAGAFQPNGLLEITPEFLDEVLRALSAADIDIIPIDQLGQRLANPEDRRFVVLTFDDGYRDNKEFAWPILKRHGAPFTLYVPSAFADGEGEVWWLALEEAIAQNNAVEVTLDGRRRLFDTLTANAKSQAFSAIIAHLMAIGTEAGFRAIVHELATRYGIDMRARCREACMGWDEIALMAADPLVTIGAHTVTHPILTKLTTDEARAEMAGGASAIEARLGRKPVHFSFPVGGPTAASTREFALAAAVGFATAVTTRPGVIFPDHLDYMNALPRISVNGEFQRLRYLDVLLSGAATALRNRFRRVDAA
jgi:peptidoglycan/xylan/chitin deacetylase (PgdA/CDA1 family)